MMDLVINGRFLAQPTTGVQRVAREITREIDGIVAEDGRDLNVRIVCQQKADLEDLPLKAIKVERLDGLPGHLWEQSSLPRVVNNATLLCLGNSAPIYSLMGRNPVAVVIHDLSYRLYPEAYQPAYRLGHSLLMPLLLRRANPIITVSESEKRQLETLAVGTGRPIIVAQNGGWRDRDDGAVVADEVLNGLPEAGYLLYVGSLSLRKNLQGLFDAAVRLARENALRFVFVGSTASIHTPTLIEPSPDVADRITFLGHIEDAHVLAEIYKRARCLVFPSYYEASPLPPVEAMHFGCPVVASDIPSLRERCDTAAEYCDPGSVDSIVEAVRRVVFDPVRSKQLIERGHQRAARFSWRAQAEAILAALTQARHRSARLKAA